MTNLPPQLPFPGSTPNYALTINQQQLEQQATRNQFYIRDRQPWAVQNELLSHDQAIYTLGEYSLFILLWHLQDYEAGLVDRCSYCSSTPDGPTSRVEKAISEAYKQPTRARCPNCYGTTFEGGIRARIVRPAIFTDADQNERRNSRGMTNTNVVNIQATTDFRVRNGDFCFRANGDRYGLHAPRRAQVRSGFGTPSQVHDAINMALAQGTLEDRDGSVAYDIPPAEDQLQDFLQGNPYVPTDFSSMEKINGPLIPTEPWDEI